MAKISSIKPLNETEIVRTLVVIFVLIAGLLWSGILQAAEVLALSKTPFEQFDVTVNFAAVAGTSAITVAGVKAIRRDTGVDASSIILGCADTPTPAVIPATKTIGICVKGGVQGDIYLIGVRATRTDTGEQFEGIITLTVSGRVPP